MGTRGVPASYSGFETCAEELGWRLAARGHDVTVYCRSHHITYPDPVYRGMKLVKLPTIRNKYLDTLCHTIVSSIHGWFQGYDAILMFIAGNSPAAFLPRLAGQRVVLNVDGLDWQRDKWPRLAKWYLQFAERLAPLSSDAVVTDAVWVQRYYREVYGANTTYIAYGSDITGLPPGETLRKYGLARNGYILFVGRLVPENRAHDLIAAFERLSRRRGLKLVIVGDASYAQEYVTSLRSSIDPDVIFTGYLFGDGYRELGANAYVFAVCSGVGGTHPVLVEAMALGNCVVVNDTPCNLEVVGDAAVPYRGADGWISLRDRLQHLIDNPEVVQEYKQKGLYRAESQFRWGPVVDQYEQLLLMLKDGKRQL
ncbi:MAG: glycosyltransferase [Chloroflexota bacterium]